MTSKLVVNTIEADTGISSVSFASSISMDSTSKFHFSAAGVDIGADTNINRPAAGVLAFNINSSEKVRITSAGVLNLPAGIGPQLRFENQHSVTTDAAISTFDDAAGTLLCLGSNFYFNSSGSETRYNTGEESAGIVINRNGMINFNTGGTGATATTRLRITSTGAIQNYYNSNLPVTDSRPILQLGYGVIGDDASGYNSVTCNAYPVSGDSSWHYIGSSSLGASRYHIGFGDHKWFTAAAGTRGNDITWSERLSITSAGKLGVGNASPTFLLDVKGATTDTFRISNSNETGHGSHDAKIVAGGSNYHNMRFEASSYKFITFDGSSTHERLRIDSSGIISMSNQPMVRTRGGWSNVDWNGYKQISWNGEDEDIGGNFSSGVFTVPTGGAGRYVLTAQFIGPSSSGFVLWSFFKNTTALNPWVQIYSTNTNTETGAGTVAITCAVGDTLRIAWHGNYFSPYNGGYNSFSIYKVH